MCVIFRSFNLIDFDLLGWNLDCVNAHYEHCPILPADDSFQLLSSTLEIFLFNL